MTAHPDTPSFNRRVADAASFLFVVVIVIYAASGPVSELVRWIIETTTPDFEELSRRDQRLLYKNHPLGAAYRSFEQSVLLPTGMILGLPLAFGFVIVSLTQHRTSWINWAMAGATSTRTITKGDMSPVRHTCQSASWVSVTTSPVTKVSSGRLPRLCSVVITPFWKKSPMRPPVCHHRAGSLGSCTRSRSPTASLEIIRPAP